MSTAAEVADGLLTARGVNSRVGTGGGVRGHAMLVDYDDHADHLRVREETKDLPGFTALFESSPGSFHVWNATVRPLNGTALAMLDLKCDPMHVSVGYRRGRWTLRVREKDTVNASGDHEEVEPAYRSAPEPLDAWVNGTDRPQSSPHVKFAAARFERDDLLDRVRDRCTLVGSHYEYERYLTLTDALKEGDV